MNKRSAIYLGVLMLAIAMLSSGISALWGAVFPSIPDHPKAIAGEKIPSNATESEEASKKNLTTLDLKKGHVVLIFDEIDARNANQAVKLIKQYSSSQTPTYLLIDSPGGSVMDGARIISAMQASSAPVYTVCLQLCASMAAMIMEYGTERYALDRSVLMFHPASLGVMMQGELDKIVSRLSFLQRYIDKMNSYVAERAGITYSEFKRQAGMELWLDAEDALAANYLDSLARLANEQLIPKPAAPQDSDVKKYLNQNWSANHGPTKATSVEVTK